VNKELQGVSKKLDLLVVVKQYHFIKRLGESESLMKGQKLRVNDLK
jgi:hypothetical protein